MTAARASDVAYHSGACDDRCCTSTSRGAHEETRHGGHLAVDPSCFLRAVVARVIVGICVTIGVQHQCGLRGLKCCHCRLLVWVSLCVCVCPRVSCGIVWGHSCCVFRGMSCEVFVPHVSWALLVLGSETSSVQSKTQCLGNTQARWWLSSPRLRDDRHLSPDDFPQWVLCSDKSLQISVVVRELALEVRVVSAQEKLEESTHHEHHSRLRAFHTSDPPHELMGASSLHHTLQNEAE